jgi:hypothetical protein
LRTIPKKGTGKDTNDRNSKMQMSQAAAAEEEEGAYEDDEQQQHGDDEIMSQFSEASIARTFISRIYAQVNRSQLPSEADANAAPSFEEPSMQARPPTPEEPQQQQQQQEIKKENASNDDEPQQQQQQQQQQQILAMDDSGDNRREFKEEEQKIEFSSGDRKQASVRIEVKRSHLQQRGAGLHGQQGQLPAESQDLKDGPPPVNYVEFERRLDPLRSAANRRGGVNGSGGGGGLPPANGGGAGGLPPPLPPANGGGGGPPPAGPPSSITDHEAKLLALTDMSRAWIRFVTLLASHFGITEADVVEPLSPWLFKDASDFNQVWFMRLRTKFSGLCTQALEEVSRATGVSQKKNCSQLVLKCPEDFAALVMLIDNDINVLKGAIWMKQTTRLDAARTRVSLLQNIAKSLGLRVRLREWC